VVNRRARAGAPRCRCDDRRGRSR